MQPVDAVAGSQSLGCVNKSRKPPISRLLLHEKANPASVLYTSCDVKDVLEAYVGMKRSN